MQTIATTGIRKVSREEGDVFLAQTFYERGGAGPVGELEKVLALTCDIQRFHSKLWGVYLEECSRSLTVVFVRSVGLVGQNVMVFFPKWFTISSCFPRADDRARVPQKHVW